MRAKAWAFGVLFLVLLGGVAVFLSGSPPAEAGFKSEKSDELVTFLESDAAFNLKLMALDALRKKKDAGVEADLAKLAKNAKLPLAIASTTALGKKKSSDAKKKLKGLFEDAKVAGDVRAAAMTAIAQHWKDEDDLSYLETKSKSDVKLKAHYAWLKSNVYGK